MTEPQDNQLSAADGTSLRDPYSFRRIVLTGFMGAGKSTVGRLLARRMHWSFMDLDPYIEATAGMAAKDIFAAHGEPAFRALESEALAFSLSQSNTVVALGGAAIDKPSNQLLLADTLEILIVFLDAPFTTLIERCLIQERNGPSPYRPLLHKTETAHTRFLARRALFAACASLTIDVAERTAEEVALLLWTQLDKPKDESRSYGRIAD